MKLDAIGLAFPEEFLRAASLVSLLSVWLLVGLFYYLNRYTRREYLSIWTGGWFFYALWMTLSLGMGEAAPGSLLFTINQSCVSISAVFLLWGSMRFLGFPVQRRLAAGFTLFLVVWVIVSPEMATTQLAMHLPVFIMLGLSSPFAAFCFLRLHQQKAFVGMGMLSLAFLLWVIYVGGYSFSRKFGNIYGFGFFIAAMLQVFIALSMIVLLFREIRRDAREVRAEIEEVRLEKEALQIKVITTEDECQNLYNRITTPEQTEESFIELNRTPRMVAEDEHLQALGRMAGDVAHDINNALSPITAYSELLLSTLPDLEDVPRQRLERISQAAENVAQIVAHMREFYRPDTDTEAADNTKTAHALEVGSQPKLDPDLPPSGSDTCRPLRILCIDDESEIRQIMHDVLELDHHEVTVATGGKEGLEIFQSSLRTGQPYEVVITDLSMPDIDGHDVARAIKAQSPQTPIIMLTGWGPMTNTDEPSAPGVDAVLGKPPRMQELSNILVQITARNAN